MEVRLKSTAFGQSARGTIARHGGVTPPNNRLIRPGRPANDNRAPRRYRSLIWWSLAASAGLSIAILLAI